MKRPFHGFCREQSGVAILEFAVTLPFLLLMLIGTVEMARYAIIIQKVDKTTSAMADYMTQGTLACQADMDIFALAANDIMSPFPFSGTIIFTSITNGVNAPPSCTSSNPSCVSWQYTPPGDGDASVIAPSGQGSTPDVLPGDYVVPPLQNAIVAEVYYDYSPMLSATATLIPALSTHKIYKVAMFKPRQASLATLQCGASGS